MDKFNFTILWNTGDDYWDNFPEEEDFFGTIDEVLEYCNFNEKEKKDGKEALLKGDVATDEEDVIVEIGIKKE